MLGFFNCKRHEDTLAQRRPAGSYAPRPNRFGIQNWCMASTTVGMSRHASRSKDGVLRQRHCESRTGRPAGSTQWNKIGSSSRCSMAFGFSTRDHASSRSLPQAPGPRLPTLGPSHRLQDRDAQAEYGEGRDRRRTRTEALPLCLRCAGAARPQPRAFSRTRTTSRPHRPSADAT